MSTPPPDSHAHATRLAQLLGDVIVHHAPHTAKTNTDETRRQVNEWLDGLEVHGAGFVGPFVQYVLDHGDPPDPVRALLEEAKAPGAAFSATIVEIFLFGVISSIVSAASTPFLQGLVNNLTGDAVGGHSPRSATDQAGNVITYAVPDGNNIARPVDAAVVATATGRGLNLGDPPTVSVQDWAYKEAANQGIDASALNLMASIIGLPPALQELFEMERRGIITVDQVKQGLREGDFRDDWIEYAVQLRHAYLTPLDFVRAAVQDQMGYEDARAYAHKTGLDWDANVPLTPGAAGHENDMFGLAYSIAGRPPGPQEMAHMVHRGIIDEAGGPNPETTFAQGIAESDIKTKWTDALFKLSAYVPPPESVGSLLERGGFTAAQAAGYWADSGVDDATVKALTFVATQQHVNQDKLLAKGEILKAYYDGIFPAAKATELLGLLGYRGDVAAEILAVQDFRREIRAIDMVVRRISTLYSQFKISAAHAQTAMESVGLPKGEAQALLRTWDAVRVAPVRVPTTAEIGKAVKAGTITEAEGLAELAALGYQPRDAAIVLSSESGVLVTPLPAAGTTTTG